MSVQTTSKQNAHLEAVLDADCYIRLARFRHEIQKFLVFSDDASARTGLTPQHHLALLFIKGFSKDGILAIADLADLLFLKQHTITELVERLANLGLVARSPDWNDTRRILLQLTSEGERRLCSLSALHLEEIGAIGPDLGELLRLLAGSQILGTSR